MKRRRINLMTLVQGDSSMTLNCWNELIETLLPKDSTILQMRNEKNNLYVGLYTGYAMQYLVIKTLNELSIPNLSDLKG